MVYGTAPSPAATLVPVPSGTAYRVESPPDDALVTPDLAHELSRALEAFARETGFNERAPVPVTFRPGVVGHHRVGRAADLYAVGGAGLDQWKRRWDDVHENGAPEAQAKERRQNLGWRLYKALQHHGRWAQPPGYPIQLFGPWTRMEGPWTRISNRLLDAHRDHIHVAR